ncbi:hypothetical protein [Rufibacter immobilis]|nr:hypothetical protein [Rufibacter immobilis]
MAFTIGGINQVALLEKSKLTGITYDATNKLDITGLTVASGATFQDIVFVKGSATLEQEQVKTATSHYITQKLKFSVLTEDNATSQAVLLGREYVALVRKNSGKWVLVGKDNGLACSVYTNNSTADDASRTYEMTADNLGDASNVTMTDAAILALINKG